MTRYLFGKATRHRIYIEMRKWFDGKGNGGWYGLCYALSDAVKTLKLKHSNADWLEGYPELMKHKPNPTEDCAFWFDRFTVGPRADICDQAIEETLVKPRKKKES